MLNTLSLSREKGELDLSAQACVKTSGMKHTHLHTLTMGRIIYHQLRV